MSGMLGYIAGTHTLVVGVEDDVDEDGTPTGDLRMYLSHRSRGIYAVIVDEAAKDKLRQAWADNSVHLTVEWPPDDALCREALAGATE